jgi:hypothetical protein
LFERAAVTRDYGALLTHWEKREEQGEALIRDADILFSALPVKQSQGHQKHVGGTAGVPVEDEDDRVPLYVSSVIQLPLPI